MKQCDSCQRTYEDDMNFCFYDGSFLSIIPDSEQTELLTKILKKPIPTSISSENTHLTPLKVTTEITERIEPCPWCNNVSKQLLKFVHSYDFDDPIPELWGVFYTNNSCLYVCEKCDKPILYNVITSKGILASDESTTSNKDSTSASPGYDFYVEYPPKILISIREYGVPYSVISCYDEAVKLKNSPNVFAVQMRRILEMICDACEIESGRLQYRLNILISKYQVPITLARALFRIKDLGNVAAHSSNKSVLPQHVYYIERFILRILDHLCLAPRDLEKLQKDSLPTEFEYVNEIVEDEEETRKFLRMRKIRKNRK